MKEKMKKIVYNATPINKRMSFKFQEYEFRFDDKLQPIPLEVPIEVAKILLQMTMRKSACCKAKAPKLLFSEVK